MRIFLFFTLIFIYSCSKQQSVLICGDHKCINKAEAKQYFEENLTIEVQIKSKNKDVTYDLVDLNTNDTKPNIKILKKKNNKVIKKLSKEEIKAKNAELKEMNKKTTSKLKNIYENKVLKNDTTKETFSSLKTSNNSIDICLKLDKCDIDSITSYLIKINKDKDFPNISLNK